MNPSLRQLEYIVAIADHGRFHAAARACHVSQPGLSAQVQQLEESLGLLLFERDRRKVLITPAGEEVVRRARLILEGAAHLVEVAHSFDRPLSGRLRMGVIPTIAPYLLPRALPRVRKRHRDLTFQLREAQTLDLLDRLQRGELDVLLLALEAPLAEVEALPLFEDPFVVAAPSSHPLAKKKHVREADLADEPMLLLEDGHCLRDQALSYCNRAGVEEASDFRATSLPTLVQMVAGGSGVTLLPELSLAIEGKTRGLSIIPFAGTPPKRTIGLAWRPTSPRAEEFRLLGELLKSAG